MRRHAKAIVVISALLSVLAFGATFASATAPVVTIDSSPTASYTTAHVTGEVNPEDHETFYEFQYSADPAGEGWSFGAFQGPLAANSGSASVSDDLSGLSGLKPGTEYEVRLVAYNFVDEPVFSAGPNPTFTTEAVGPSTVSIDPVTIFTGTTAHFSGQINPNAPEAAPTSTGVEAGFKVSWHFECTPACPGLSGAVAAGNAPHTVEAEASGLEPNTSYEVSLVTENAGGQDSDGPQLFKTEAVSPEVQTLWAGMVDSEGAVLAANVNPKNSATSYQFEWGEDATYGNVAPTSPQSVGAEDDGFHVVTAQVTGLQSHTAYHFRAVAINADIGAVAKGVDHRFTTSELAGPTTPPSCPNAEFRVGPSASLPDCRAYEKVSPDIKNGLNMSTAFLPTPSGDEISILLQGRAPGGNAGTDISKLIASRDIPNGWTSAAPDPMPPPGAFWALSGTSGSLTPLTDPKTVVASGSALTPDATYRTEQLYLRDNSVGSYVLLTPRPGPTGSEPPYGAFNGHEPRVASISPDFTHVLYESMTPQADGPNGPLTPGMYYPYEWIQGQGVRLAAVFDDGSSPPFGARPAAGNRSKYLWRSLSRDGSRFVFHTTEPDLDGSAPMGQLYVRQDLDLQGPTPPETIHISASKRTDCADDPSCGGDDLPDPAPDPDGPAPPTYWSAEVEHGDKVLFSSCEKLTDDSKARFDGSCELISGRRTKSASDLYLYDLNNRTLTDLTSADPSGADVQGVVGTSDDLERIYFVASGVLDAGATKGEPNLYLWDHGVTHFLSTLTFTDSGLPEAIVGDENNWSVWAESSNVATRTTASGRYLLFTSRARLTGYDNHNPKMCTTNMNPDGNCAEVYRYDAEVNEVTCVSCDPSGDLPRADTVLYYAYAAPGPSRQAPHNLSDGRQRVFFETSNSLTRKDSNGKVDVYEWESGQLHLMSAGNGADDTHFADATPDGDSVFLVSFDKLSGEDHDNLADIYSARVGGGLIAPDQPSPACEGESCQSPIQVPNDPTPGSSSFVRPGDQPATSFSRRKCARRKTSASHLKRRCARKQAGRKSGRHADHKRVGKG